MEVVGLTDMWREQIELGKSQNEESGKKVSDQILSQLNPNDEYRKRFSGAFNNFMKKLEAPWPPEEIVDVWAGYYGSNFTDEELDGLIKFYSSDLGRKDIAVTKTSMVQFTQHFQQKLQPLLEQATQEYMEEMKILTQECNCRKK